MAVKMAYDHGAVSVFLEDLNVFNFSSKVPDHNAAVNVFQMFGIIPKRETARLCYICGKDMRVNDRKDSSLGWEYVCRDDSHGKVKQSPLIGTWLENVRLELHKVLMLLICFLTKQTIAFCCSQVGVSDKTVLDWYSMFREVCDVYVTSVRQDTQIGGPFTHVEIDETHVSKNKYNRGRQTVCQKFYTFGGICEETGERFYELVT